MSCKNSIDLKPAFISTFNNLYNYASITNSSNYNLYEPSSNIYGNNILNNSVGFSNNITPNIDFDNINGNEDIIENKDNIFIIDNKNNNIYENCVITSGIPWYSTNNKFNKCEISKDIELDKNNILKLGTDKKTINYNFKSTNKNAPFCSHYKNTTKAYCENSWYDWLIIPNYYLGNSYYKDIGKYTEKDVYKCYKPCEGDYLPFTDSDNVMKCIPKKLYSGGLLINKYKYSALGLINLIGNISTYNSDIAIYNNKQNLTYINYYLIFYYKHKKNIDYNIYKTNEIYNDIINTSENTQQKFQKFVLNIQNIEQEFINCIKKEIIDYDNFDYSANQIYDNLNIFSYKSVEFHEITNDLITFNGLEHNNILIDPILIHIWILANIYRPYEKSDLEKISTISDSPEAEKEISLTELYDLLLNINFIDDKDKDKDDNYNKNKNINISIRLKNIFFKAVNICYNNKTNFSANIINKTKKALQNKELVDLIIDKEFYINTNYKYTNKKKYDNFSSKDNLKTFLDNSITYLDTFEEITYYNEIDLYDMFYTIKSTELVKKFFNDVIESSIPHKYKYLFTVENLESSNICKINEVYDPVTVKCNPRPQKTEIITKKEDIDSIDDNFELSKIKYLLQLFMQIVFVIIIGYLCYLFYNIFGETIIASFNLILINFEYFFNNIRINSLETNILANENNEDSNKYKDYNKILQIKLNQENEEFENLKTKIDIIEDYIKENKLDEDEDKDKD